MKASEIEPGPSPAADPLARSTGMKTIFPGGSKAGDVFRSPIQARITSIQMGRAASEPDMLAPIGFFRSMPIQTPTVMSGSNPMNHASV
jgi:hypothetical protein